MWWSIMWCAVILMVYTTLYTVSFHTRSIQSYKRVLQLEMATIMGQGIDKMAVQSVSSDWERYVAVTDSAIRLTNANGDVLFETGSPIFSDERMRQISSAIQPQTSAKASPLAVQWSRSYFWRDQNGMHHVLTATTAVQFANGTRGELQVFSLTDALRGQIWQTLKVLLVIDVLVLALFAVGVRWLIHHGLRPLRRLIEGIQAVEWKQSERLSMRHLPSEVASLQQSINQLLDRIDDGVQEQNRFIADASHELRTPLAIIAGHANLLRRWGNQNTRVWEPAVRNIVSEVSRLQKLVNQLLSMAKLEASEVVPVDGLTAADIKKLFRQLQEDAKLLRPDLEIVWTVHLTSKSRAYMDHDDLRQVLIGLLDNAMRHTQNGGRIELSAHGDEGMVRFLISDNGEGIPPDVLPYVFDRFYRAEASRGRGKGSGLGLSICKQVIESYQGKIYVRSQLGRGTSVIILVPIQQFERSRPTDTQATHPMNEPAEKGHETDDGQINSGTDAESHRAEQWGTVE
ncbi:sensor histidine kinase [Alicyclobacillus dauci]|uniref:histidine kinase n=1 Tax=Alicyclobacillus dauci TaxID=1475485 RepID=A0ABY6Z606_9BACL|nr:HAMP domain-containing sensor histidine kinase [Alicyclobacillus dauci]WAH38098.1 HAMP domain-containing histidine kinase [Alicyclobacillus dauci]